MALGACQESIGSHMPRRVPRDLEAKILQLRVYGTAIIYYNMQLCTLDTATLVYDVA